MATPGRAARGLPTGRWRISERASEPPPARAAALPEPSAALDPARNRIVESLMPETMTSRLHDLVSRNERHILENWLRYQSASTRRRDLSRDEEVRTQTRQFLEQFVAALRNGTDPDAPAWAPVRDLLTEISGQRVRQGFTLWENASFVFSLKQPLFDLVRSESENDGTRLAEETWTLNVLLDRLGLHTAEIYQQGREEVIARQQEEMLELSTPVVQLSEGILALPLIGTLDSGRTQVVMENLLQKIVDTGAGIAIIDITGVPTVDTLVAQHLLKTVAAARLMGAECIISGIRPQIAQTIVHLGVSLDEVITKGNLADAFAIALERTGRRIQALPGARA
jgi:rsbT co-antagonist protein RsbR